MDNTQAWLKLDEECPASITDRVCEDKGRGNTKLLWLLVGNRHERYQTAYITRFSYTSATKPLKDGPRRVNEMEDFFQRRYSVYWTGVTLIFAPF